MATTTNYGWTTPDNTAYVKDGAAAIRSLGSAVDTTSATTNAAGLVFIKSQTIGSAVSSVTVTSAFNSTYDSYKIVVTGGVGSASSADLDLSLTGISTNYYNNLVYGAFNSTAVTGAFNGPVSTWRWNGTGTTSSLNAEIELHNPNLAKTKYVKSTYNTNFVNVGTSQGANSSTVQATGFTLALNTGTMTGGTVSVYGYRKAI
jgi:hypothetical protein